MKKDDHCFIIRRAGFFNSSLSHQSQGFDEIYAITLEYGQKHDKKN